MTVSYQGSLSSTFLHINVMLSGVSKFLLTYSILARVAQATSLATFFIFVSGSIIKNIDSVTTISISTNPFFKFPLPLPVKAFPSFSS